MSTATQDRVGGVAVDLVGDGLPVTVFAHGLGGSSAETRSLATRLSGTRVLLTFRGHGRSDAFDGGWSYDALADDLLAVADAVDADRVCALSVGSGALLRALTRDADRFARIACVLPAALDGDRADAATERVRALGDAIDEGDVDAVTALLMLDVPEDWRERRGVGALLRRRAAALCERPAPRPAVVERPLTSRTLLSAVTAPALVVAQEGDPLHSTEVAVDLAAALPVSDLLVLPPGGVFWSASRQAQDALADHLTPAEKSA